MLDNKYDDWGFYSKTGRYLITAAFSPYSGQYLPTSYTVSYVEAKGRFFESEDPGRELVELKIQEMYAKWRAEHIGSKVCTGLYDLVLGHDVGMTRAEYLPVIRAYIVWKKRRKNAFDTMNYCPFCGEKLPERLDDVLTGILQKEYGLSSWTDYRKAPPEFHTDEWWKKRLL